MSSFQTLDNRSVIAISGPDALNFLQSIISNDITKVTDENAIYSLILSPQGKYLFDFFISKLNDTFLLECSKSQKEALVKKLKLYKLKSKIEISDTEYYVGYHTENMQQIKCYKDPRHDQMGYRIISDHRTQVTDDYDYKRISLSLVEGEYDLLQDKSFPLEYGLDYLNAIDFKKGCYVGQEVTARTKYRGVVRKRIFKVTSSKNLPKQVSDIVSGENKIGTLLSSYANMGIAIIKFESYNEESEVTIPDFSGKLELNLASWYNL